jgi:hypothetical protein
MLGIDRFPGDDTIRNFFLRFSQTHVEAFWRSLWKWSLGKLAVRAEGFHLDLDSTVLQRSGRQEGAAKGYNPNRPGRKSHHPLLAVLAEAPFILHDWLRRLRRRGRRRRAIPNRRGSSDLRRGFGGTGKDGCPT